jgi:hypothetical protein
VAIKGNVVQKPKPKRDELSELRLNGLRHKVTRVAKAEPVAPAPVVTHPVQIVEQPKMAVVNVSKDYQLTDIISNKNKSTFMMDMISN